MIVIFQTFLNSNKVRIINSICLFNESKPYGTYDFFFECDMFLQMVIRMGTEIYERNENTHFLNQGMNCFVIFL